MDLNGLEREKCLVVRMYAKKMTVAQLDRLENLFRSVQDSAPRLAAWVKAQIEDERKRRADERRSIFREPVYPLIDVLHWDDEDVENGLTATLALLSVETRKNVREFLVKVGQACACDLCARLSFLRKRQVAG